MTRDELEQSLGPGALRGCTTASGTYRGSGTRCAPVTCTPQEVTVCVSQQDPVTAAAIARPGLKLADWLADGLTLDTVAQLDLVLYDLAVFGNGGGPST